jgi:hypothetical protein
MNRRIAHLLGAAALAALTLQPVAALADPPPHAQNDKHWQDCDSRRHQVVLRLPPRARVVHYRGDRYYYGGGQWYRPYRSGYRIVAPPVGLFLSFRPDYYVWHPNERGYVVTDRPVQRW